MERRVATSCSVSFLWEWREFEGCCAGYATWFIRELTVCVDDPVGWNSLHLQAIRAWYKRWWSATLMFMARRFSSQRISIRLEMCETWINKIFPHVFFLKQTTPIFSISVALRRPLLVAFSSILLYAGDINYLDRNNPSSPSRVVAGHKTAVTCVAAQPNEAIFSGTRMWLLRKLPAQILQPISCYDWTGYHF